MPNTYFRFQQFVVRQDKCAMKVCTDACLFGAWLANRVENVHRALDIGAGTGLLSLMVAQKSTALIDAVEIDADACAQAGENFRESSWAARLHIVKAPIQQFAEDVCRQNGSRYDLIFSNPPFFANDLKSPDSRRNVALHSEALNLGELVAAAAGMMEPEGLFALIVPYQRAGHVEKLAGENGFYIRERADVRQTAQHTFFRSMYLLCATPCRTVATSEITINNDNQKYTPEFRELMKDYYLVADNALR